MESIRLRKLSTLAMLCERAPQEYRSTASIEMPVSCASATDTPQKEVARTSADIKEHLDEGMTNLPSSGQQAQTGIRHLFCCWPPILVRPYAACRSYSS